MLPDTTTLTDEQYKSFLAKHVTNEHGRKALANILAQGNSKPTENNKTTTANAKPNTQQNPKPETQASQAAKS